ncbi:MAG: hypothetical protein IJ786_04885 [Bacteroidaceae bacterium]|nr:hypothetical protein [Bacteroidaceae bacterium]
MKKYLSHAAFALMMAASVFSLASCGGDDDDNNNGDDPNSSTLTPAGRAAVAVDLGLPSGTRWADRNVGADKPQDAGYLFAWGETAQKNTYNWDSYKWYADEDVFTYTGSVLDPKDDAARANWGGNWRLPTQEELEELRYYTNYEWVVNYNNTGINGYKFTNMSDPSKFIFMPAAGYSLDTNIRYVGRVGSYWGSTLDKDSRAATLVFDDTDADSDVNYTAPYVGQSVRPVQ